MLVMFFTDGFFTLTLNFGFPVTCGIFLNAYTHRPRKAQ